ncbi:hypothetical protein J2Z32_001926 [Paenibacillus turicensis]|uniref:Group-specific protein n=1 Tax=Paenibacillus turicensis TaxID=160487 RepID=A0ABS4FRT4_9BACL|nr:DUF771 domain-containing protein [Paenibacillus turicensis]MBP1905298.1 hypothetical protein [Paenibacillus turicensis]
MSVVSVVVNESEVVKQLKQKLAEIIKDYDAELVFWDSKELMKRTCMSWNFIQEQFFYDPRFKKKKVNSKWLFPARETREFLELWLSEQTNG